MKRTSVAAVTGMVFASLWGGILLLGLWGCAGSSTSTPSSATTENPAANGAISGRVNEMLETKNEATVVMARNFKSQLGAAAGVWAASHGQMPKGFTDFVTDKPLSSGDAYSISTSSLGNGQCHVAAALIDCKAAFPTLSTVRYSWADESISAEIQQ